MKPKDVADDKDLLPPPPPLPASPLDILDLGESDVLFHELKNSSLRTMTPASLAEANTVGRSKVKVPIKKDKEKEEEDQFREASEDKKRIQVKEGD